MSDTENHENTDHNDENDRKGEPASIEQEVGPKVAPVQVAAAPFPVAAIPGEVGEDGKVKAATPAPVLATTVLDNGNLINPPAVPVSNIESLKGKVINDIAQLEKDLGAAMSQLKTLPIEDMSAFDEGEEFFKDGIASIKKAISEL